MRYLADECLGRLIVSKLRHHGHDVEWVGDVSKGIPDELVLAWSVRDERVLLTEDFDYGDLIFSRGHPGCGVVMLQLSTFRVRGTKSLRQLWNGWPTRKAGSSVI